MKLKDSEALDTDEQEVIAFPRRLLRTLTSMPSTGDTYKSSIYNKQKKAQMLNEVWFWERSQEKQHYSLFKAKMGLRQDE